MFKIPSNVVDIFSGEHLGSFDHLGTYMAQVNMNRICSNLRPIGLNEFLELPAGQNIIDEIVSKHCRGFGRKQTYNIADLVQAGIITKDGNAPIYFIYRICDFLSSERCDYEEFEQKEITGNQETTTHVVE